MRKIILMMLLATVSSSAMAEWVKVRGTDRWEEEIGSKYNETDYVNPTTISKNGERVKILAMKDLTSPRMEDDGLRWTSTKYKLEFDCEFSKFRVVSGEKYSEHMGKGKRVESISSSTSKFVSPSPQSPYEAMLEIACRK